MSSFVDRNAKLISELCTEFRIDVRMIRAFIAVETQGEGLSGGHPIVRIEVHKLWTKVPREKRAAVDSLFHVGGPKAWQGHQFRRDNVWTKLHQPGAAGQVLERIALQHAKAIDTDAAICSTSYGCGQVVGEEWRRLGFASAVAFEAGQATEAGQLRTMFLFLRDVAHLVDAMAARSWYEIARRYNGPGEAEWYAERLRSAYETGR